MPKKRETVGEPQTGEATCKPQDLDTCSSAPVRHRVDAKPEPWDWSDLWTRPEHRQYHWGDGYKLADRALEALEADLKHFDNKRLKTIISKKYSEDFKELRSRTETVAWQYLAERHFRDVDFFFNSNKTKNKFVNLLRDYEQCIKYLKSIEAKSHEREFHFCRVDMNSISPTISSIEAGVVSAKRAIDIVTRRDPDFIKGGRPKHTERDPVYRAIGEIWEFASKDRFDRWPKVDNKEFVTESARFLQIFITAFTGKISSSENIKRHIEEAYNTEPS